MNRRLPNQLPRRETQEATTVPVTSAPHGLQGLPGCSPQDLAGA